MAKVEYYKKYVGTSKKITVVLKAIGVSDTSKANIKKIATRNSIKNYKGTNTQDIKMINLAKKGKLIKKTASITVDNILPKDLDVPKPKNLNKQVLGKIRYKNFVFPYNPERTVLKCGRSYIQHKYPSLAGAELEDFSIDAISITGEGVFFGKGAYKAFRQLYRTYKRKKVGKVSHPIFTEVTRGLMVNLEGRVEPELNVIHYSFEIIADTAPTTKEKKKPKQKKNKKKNSQKNSKNGKSKNKTKKTYKEGDIVQFNGGTHYLSSYPNAKGSPATAGTAKITKDPSCKGNGHAHPWHLIHTDSSSNVYGWVDEGTFS
jgi:hypothetical protein